MAERTTMGDDEAYILPPSRRPPRREAPYVTETILGRGERSGQKETVETAARHIYKVRLSLKCQPNVRNVNGAALLRQFLAKAQSIDEDLFFLPYEEESQLDPIQCAKSIPNCENKLGTYWAGIVTDKRTVTGFARLTSKVKFGALKHRMFDWLHKSGHWLEFKTTKTLHPQECAFLVKVHPLNTNLAQLGGWINEKICENGHLDVEVAVFPKTIANGWGKDRFKTQTLIIEADREKSGAAWAALK